MAFSPASPRGLISQLTQTSRRDNFAASPSPRRALEDELNLTVSSFQPDIESTQQFDTATQEHSMDRHNEIPAQVADFGDDSMSIEIARGLKGSARNSPYRNAFDDDFSENPIISLGDSLYEVTGAPPIKNTAARKYSDMRPESLRKQASVRRASAMPQLELTKTSDIVPPKQRPINASNRRSLSNVHAKVNEEGNSTIIEDSRQLKEKSSRFAKSRIASGDLKSFPTRFATQDGLDGVSRNNTPRRATSAPDPAFTGNQTAQSFMLPNLPEINELVSGVRKDGTPVFAKSAKAKSRFSSASYARGANHDITQHAAVHGINLPEDEKAIFTSLQLLQTKVADLEHEKNEVSRKLEDYANAVITLKAQLQAERRLRRPDSGLSMDDENSTKDKWRVERSNLQATIRATQERLERSERKLSVSDIALKRITQERENVVTQLGVAFYNNEELKDENERLQRENDELHQSQRDGRKAIEAMQAKNEKWQTKYTTIQTEAKEAAVAFSRRESELKQQIAEHSQLRQTKENSRPARNTEQQQTKTAEPEFAPYEQIRRSKGAIDQAAVSNILDRFEEGIRKVRAEAAGQIKSTVPSSSQESVVEKPQYKTQKRSTSTKLHRIVSNTIEPDEPTAAKRDSSQRDSEGNTAAATTVDENLDEITSLSFLDPEHVSNLRKQLEIERLARRSGQAALVTRTSSKGDTERPETFIDSKSGRTRVRIQSPRSADAVSYEEPDGVTDMSLLSNSSRRPQFNNTEEMTSGFILPDITLKNTDIHIAHKSDNCTSCPVDTTKPAIKIPKPTPVTERNVDETDVTMRPSQPPAEALATVLKQLEDEVTHLKIKLTGYEKVYSSHDPALCRRKRKAVKAKIDSLLTDIERRSEQIYALYDVLEGQKGGQSRPKDVEEMDQEEVEETLQSLGIDVAELTHKASKTNKAAESVAKKTGYETLDDILDASDESLRWEGFNSGESDDDSTT